MVSTASPFASATDQVALAAALADCGLAGVDALEAFGRALAGDGAARLWPRSERARSREALTVGFFMAPDNTARMLSDGVSRWRLPRSPVRATVACDPGPSREESEAVLARHRAMRAAARAAAAGGGGGGQ